MGIIAKLFGLGQKSDPVDESSPFSLSYFIAYTALRRIAHQDMGKIKEIWKLGPEAAGQRMFEEGCRMAELEPDPDMAKKFRAVRHPVGGMEFFVLVHPAPDPVDLSDLDPVDVIQSGEMPQLSPYLSCVAYDPAGDNAKIYVLGQSAIGEGTNLRSVAANGKSSSLGPGPEPKIDYFLDAIWQR